MSELFSNYIYDDSNFFNNEPLFSDYNNQQQQDFPNLDLSGTPSFINYSICSFDQFLKNSNFENYNLENTTTQNITPLKKDDKGEILESQLDINNKEPNSFLFCHFNQNPFNIQQENNTNSEDDKSNKIQLFNVKYTEKRIRIDYLIKNLKVCISKCIKNYINYLISKNFPKNELSKLKINKPSTKFYTSVTKISVNFEFLKMSIKSLLTMGKDDVNGTRQKKNAIVIQKIEKISVIKEFLETTLQNFYEGIFSDSKEFKEFCENERNILLDEEFKRENGYSLKEKYGYLKYINDNRKK